MRIDSSRIPYLFAGIALGLLIVLAWVNQDRFASVTPGNPAPSFVAADLEGREVALEDFRGKVVLLNIWATWCPPCIHEMPSMQRLYESFEGEPFEIVAVSIDARRGERDEFGRRGGEIRDFVEDLGLEFLILHDPEGRVQRKFRTTGVPESFVIGKDGVIYKKVAGATEWDAEPHQELIRRLLDA